MLLIGVNALENMLGNTGTNYDPGVSEQELPMGSDDFDRVKKFIKSNLCKQRKNTSEDIRRVSLYCLYHDL